MLTDELSVLTRELGAFGANDSLTRMLASLVAASNEFIGVADLAGNASFVNEAGRQLVGLRDLEAVHSTKIIDYFAPGDQPTVIDVVLPAVRKTGFWQGELRFRNFATGKLVPVLYNIFPIRDSSGAITAYGTVTRDLTEAKLAEQRFRLLASIVESSDDAIVGKNLEGVVTSWNKGAERVFGYAAEEAIGRPITIVIPKERHDEERDILSRIKRGERIDHFETVRQRKDGSLIAISLTVSPVKDTEGTIVGASKIARDITEQKRNQEQISALAHEAEHRSKNLLTIVQAIVRISQSDTPDGLKHAIDGRIRALANVHSLFAGTRWLGADLKTIATNELAPYCESDETRVRMDGPQVLLEPDSAQAVAVTLHELSTNALKYGALSVATGSIELQWSYDRDGSLMLRWIETGGPVLQKPTHRGFGGRIVEDMVRQLKGKIQYDWRPDGLVCEISLPA